MSFKEAIKTLRLDLTRLVIEPEGGYGMGASFALKSKEYLSFAKQDFADDSKRGFTNSVSNAKRAIDCQIDATLKFLGLSNDQGKEHREKMLQYFKEDFKHEATIPESHKAIQALNLAPMYLIWKYRKLRNEIEHEYNFPSKESAREMIDLAELFIRAIVGHYKIVEADFIITDSNLYDSGRIKDTNHISLSFNDKHGLFSCSIHRKDEEHSQFQVTPSDHEFLGLIRLMNSIDDNVELNRSLKFLLYMIDNPIPIEKAKITQTI